MKNFDFKRFWNVVKCDFAMVKPLFVPYAVVTAALVVLSIVLRVVLWDLHLPWTSYAVNGVLILAIGLSTYMPSVMFGFVGDRRQCSGVLMQPASNIEKFTSRMVVYWLVPVVFSLLMFFLAPISYSVHTVFSMAGEFQNSVWYEYRLSICLIGCLSGILIFTGSVFRRKALLKTMAIIVALIVLIGVIGYFLSPHIPSSTIEIVDGQYVAKYAYDGFPFNFIHWIERSNMRISVFQIALALSFVAAGALLAYRRFCRLTLKS